MVVYWLLFSYFATGAALSRPRQDAGELRVMLIVGALLIVTLIGFRYEVGGDWQQYQLMFTYTGYVDLVRALEVGDPGYQFLNWAAQQLGAEIWLVNLISGVIFSWGLYRFATTQPDPWVTILIAVPYMVIVVGMGYSRQAVALGIIMAGLASVGKGRSTLIRFGAYVAFAALFHRSAVIVFPLVAFTSSRTTLVNIAVALFGTVFLYDMFLQNSMDAFVEQYIRTAYASEGAAVRVAMNLLPAILFLIYHRRFVSLSIQQRQIWRNFSYAAVGLLIALMIVPSSTVVDRLALYVMPLQLAVLSQVPAGLVPRGSGRALVMAYSAIVLLVWLNSANHAQYWVPYKFYPL